MLQLLSRISLLLFSLTLYQTSHAFHFDESKYTIQLGGAMNTGNTDTTNVTASIGSEIHHGKFDIGQSLAGQLSTSKGIESARSLKGNANINYEFSTNTYTSTYDYHTYSAVSILSCFGT